MKSLKWEGIGTKNVFPHTSNLNYIHASESTLDNGTSGTASHSVDTTYWQLFRPDINTAYFYFYFVAEVMSNYLTIDWLKNFLYFRRPP